MGNLCTPNAFAGPRVYLACTSAACGRQGVPVKTVR